jgi:hypothetical protein
MWHIINELYEKYCQARLHEMLKLDVNRHWNGTPYQHPKGTPLIGVFCW